MSKILFLSQLLPYPPDTGAKVRSYYTLRYLCKKHQVTLLAFTRPDDPPQAIDHLKGICADVHMVPIRRSRLHDIQSMVISLLRGISFIIERDFFPEMASKVDQLLSSENFDAVHADQLWMAQYALRAKSSKTNARLVLDEHNACYQIIQRLAEDEANPVKRRFLAIEWRSLQRYEARACAQFDRIVTVTDEDQAILRDLITRDNSTKHKDVFSTIPICVDTQEVQAVKPSIGSCNIFHLGTMFYLPNIAGILWFVREVWPQIQAQIPQASLTIAGKNPPPEIKSLSTSNHENTPIHVTGYVPDPQPFLEQAGVFIVPLLSGGGMRVKIVDAWRWGLPIVSTSIGAEGIKYLNGDNILIADGSEAFATAVLRVLLNPDFAQKLRENGRRWVEQRYDWRAVYTAWDRIHP